MKEKSDGRWGCDQDSENGAGDIVYALTDDFGDVDEFWAGIVDDGGTILGTDGDGSVLCRVYIFTVH